MACASARMVISKVLTACAQTMVVERVFGWGADALDVHELPERSSLQRNLKHHLLQGGVMYDVGGVVVEFKFSPTSKKRMPGSVMVLDGEHVLEPPRYVCDQWQHGNGTYAHIVECVQCWPDLAEAWLRCLF